MMTRVHRNRVITTALALLFLLLAIFVSTVIYVDHVDYKADQRDIARQRQFCEVIVLIDDRYQALPGATLTEATKQFAVSLHKYRVAIGCA